MIDGYLHDELNNRLPLSISRTSTMLERMRGLLFRPKLAGDEGLWIEPCNSIHTFFMRFSIDAIFIDGTGTVIKVVPDMPAWRMTGSYRAVAVLELLGGVAESLGIEKGRRFRWGH